MKRKITLTGNAALAWIKFADDLVEQLGRNAMVKNYIKDGRSNNALDQVRLRGPLSIEQAWDFACAAGYADGDVYGHDGLDKAGLPHEVLAVLVGFLYELQYCRALLSDDEYVAVMEGLTQTISGLLGVRWTSNSVKRAWKIDDVMLYTDERSAAFAAQCARQCAERGQAVSVRRARSLLSYVVTKLQGREPSRKPRTTLMAAMDCAFEKWDDNPKAEALPERYGAAYAIVSAGLSREIALEVLLSDGYNFGLPADRRWSQIVLADLNGLEPARP